MSGPAPETSGDELFGMALLVLFSFPHGFLMVGCDFKAETTKEDRESDEVAGTEWWVSGRRYCVCLEIDLRQ